jgi:hypothetical protein
MPGLDSIRHAEAPCRAAQRNARGRPVLRALALQRTRRVALGSQPANHRHTRAVDGEKQGEHSAAVCPVAPAVCCSGEDPMRRSPDVGLSAFVPAGMALPPRRLLHHHRLAHHRSLVLVVEIPLAGSPTLDCPRFHATRQSLISVQSWDATIGSAVAGLSSGLLHAVAASVRSWHAHLRGQCNTNVRAAQGSWLAPDEEVRKQCGGRPARHASAHVQVCPSAATTGSSIRLRDTGQSHCSAGAHGRAIARRSASATSIPKRSLC